MSMNCMGYNTKYGEAFKLVLNVVDTRKATKNVKMDITHTGHNRNIIIELPVKTFSRHTNPLKEDGPAEADTR